MNMRFNEKEPIPTAKWFCPHCKITTIHKLIRLGIRGEIRRYKCNLCGSIFDAPKSTRVRMDNRSGGYKRKGHMPIKPSRKKNRGSWQPLTVKLSGRRRAWMEKDNLDEVLRQ